MRIEKNIVFKKFRKDLTIKYGDKKAESIWGYANREMNRLVKAEPDADNNSISFVFPAVALYRAIERYAPGDALSTTREYGTRTGIRLKKIFRTITALPGAPYLIWKNMDKIAAKMSSGYECRNVKVTSHSCSLDVISCPLYDKAKELGTPEAAQMICCMDKQYMKGFRGICYRRTKSVAEGNDCCDYRLKDSRRRRK